MPLQAKAELRLQHFHSLEAEIGHVEFQLLIESLRNGDFADEVVLAAYPRGLSFLLVVHGPEQVAEMLSRAALKASEFSLEVKPLLHAIEQLREYPCCLWGRLLLHIILLAALCLSLI